MFYGACGEPFASQYDIFVFNISHSDFYFIFVQLRSVLIPIISVDARSSFFLRPFRGLYDVFLAIAKICGIHLFGALACVTLVFAFGVV